MIPCTFLKTSIKIPRTPKNSKNPKKYPENPTTSEENPMNTKNPEEIPKI